MSKVEIEISEILKLDYSVVHGSRNVRREIERISNKKDFERLLKLCIAKYYLRINLHRHTVTDEIYLWIFGVKAKSPSFNLKLKINDEILNIVMGYIATGELVDVSGIDADNLETFNKRISNFPLELYKGEVAKGQRKIRHISNTTYSKYDYGMIIYDTINNEELRDFIDSTII